MTRAPNLQLQYCTNLAQTCRWQGTQMRMKPLEVLRPELTHLQQYHSPLTGDTLLEWDKPPDRLTVWIRDIFQREGSCVKVSMDYVTLNSLCNSYVILVWPECDYVRCHVKEICLCSGELLHASNTVYTLYFDIYSLKFLIQINFLLNLVWGLLFKCSFGTAMGFGDTWHNVIAVKGDVQVTQPYTYPMGGCILISMTFVNITWQSRNDICGQCMMTKW